MIAAIIIIIFHTIFMVSSCGPSLQKVHNDYMQKAAQLHAEDVDKYKKAAEEFNQDSESYLIKKEQWERKYQDFVYSLSDEELQAQAEFMKAVKQADKKFIQGDANCILAKRNFIKILSQSENPNKLLTYNKLCREAYENIKQYENLVAKDRGLEKWRKRLVEFEQAQEKYLKEEQERLRHKEMVTAINRIRSQQWLQHQEMLHQQQLMQQQQWLQNQQLMQQQLWGK